MHTPTYKEGFDKITVDYIEDKIEPYNANFCFCGSLNNHSGSWQRNGSLFYSSNQFFDMERALLKTIAEQTIGLDKMQGVYYACSTPEVDSEWLRGTVKSHQNYENALFNGMCNALDVLKQIHIERGEIIDTVPVFKKRELVNQ